MAITIARRPVSWDPSFVTLELPAFSEADVVPVLVEDGAAIEAFVKIAASGELGDKPNSSGHKMTTNSIANEIETLVFQTLYIFLW